MKLRTDMGLLKIERFVLFVSSAVVLSLVLSACSPGVAASNSDPVEIAHGASGVAEEPAKASALTPPVVGMSLENAELFLAEYNLEARPTDVSAAVRDVKYPEQWLILSQSPKPGEPSRPDGAVEVEVIKHGEDSSYIEVQSAGDVKGQRNTVMVNLVGMKLDAAYDVAKAQNLNIINEIDGGGSKRHIWVRSNWTVTGQDAAPSTRESSVIVTVQKSDEVSSDDLQTTWMHSNWDVSALYGRVTGFVSDDYVGNKDKNVVVIDKSPIELDLIGPYSAACLKPVNDLTSQAVKEQALPLDTKVLVVFKAPWDESGFVHKLDELQLDELNVNSVNEQLVATGNWVPDHWAFHDSEIERGETTTYKSISDWGGSLTATESAYAYLILKMGSQARANPVGGVVACLDQGDAYQAEQVHLKEEVDEAIRQGEADYQRRKALGWFNCRDGDGDGVCNER
jgi:hypothetical protein